MQETRQSSVTLVLGGVRSGKSRYAQQLAARADRVVFVATATACDEEMHRKIERHRQNRPAGWLTIEEPLELPQVLAKHAPDHDAMVVDCLTLYTANLLKAAGGSHEIVAHRMNELCAALRSAECPIVLVSNEVGSGVVPASESGRAFRDWLGEINQSVAAVADDVVLMVAGLPLALKGHVEVMP